MRMPSSSGSMLRSSGIESPHQPEACEKRQDRKHHRTNYVESRQGVFALLQQQDAVERKGREGGIATQNTDRQKSAQLRRQIQFQRAHLHDDAHQQTTRDVDDE